MLRTRGIIAGHAAPTAPGSAQQQGWRHSAGCGARWAGRPAGLQSLAAGCLVQNAALQHMQLLKPRRQHQQRQPTLRAAGAQALAAGSSGTVRPRYPLCIALHCACIPPPCRSYAPSSPPFYTPPHFSAPPALPCPQQKVLTLPTLLTLARVAAVPALVAAWYSSAPWAGAACTWLFVGASLTDYLDGLLARKMVSTPLPPSTAMRQCLCRCCYHALRLPSPCNHLPCAPALPAPALPCLATCRTPPPLLAPSLTRWPTS